MILLTGMPPPPYGKKSTKSNLKPSLRWHTVQIYLTFRYLTFKGMQNSPFFTKVYGSCVQNAVPLEWEPLSAFCMSDGTWRSIFDDVGSIFHGGCQCMAGYEVHAYTSHLIAKQCFSFFPSLTARSFSQRSTTPSSRLTTPLPPAWNAQQESTKQKQAQVHVKCAL